MKGKRQAMLSNKIIAVLLLTAAVWGGARYMAGIGALAADTADGAPPGGKASASILDGARDGIAKLLQKEQGGPAAIRGNFDIKDSPYFKAVDVYHLRSQGSLLVLENYRTRQQQTEYTCGPAAALTVVEHFTGASLDDEFAVAKIMNTHPAGVKDPGTNTRGMSRYFTEKGWTVKNSLQNGSPKTYEDFLEFVDDNLRNDIPIMVENVDWGGHWKVIIGHDTMGDTSGTNDVLLFADPYDTTDHVQDGYGVVPAQRFYYMWFDAHLFRERERQRPWLTAVPPDHKKKP